MTSATNAKWRRLSIWILASAAILTKPTFGQQPAAPAQQATPAAVPQTFARDGGFVLNFVKPDKTADFEAVILKLKEAFAKIENPERKQQARGWKVFKSSEPGAGGVAVYVFMIDPPVKGADYTVSKILAEAFSPEETNRLYKQYAEAYASGLNVVDLSLVADFGK